jgi:thiol-disulfide isomerase/thioredoxin
MHKLNKIELDIRVVLRAIRFFATVLMMTVSVSAMFQTRSAPASSGQVVSVEEKYPGLATGVLKSAELKEMPAGIILRTENVEIRESHLQEKMVAAEPKIREQLQNNLFFLLEQEATMKMLVHEAMNSGIKTEGLSDTEAIKTHLDHISQQASVPETEVKAFYEANKEMVGGLPFEQVKDSMHEFLLQQKKSETIDGYITGLGNRNTIQVDQAWAKTQYHKAQDNPVDRARMSGKPTMVEFGATGCVPCDMMQPILDNLRKNYPDQLNVVFVHVGEEQVLAARFGIRAIPVQVFFDAQGKEVFRHVGFFAQTEVTKQLSQMGVTK